jgi:hypothetical protein
MKNVLTALLCLACCSLSATATTVQYSLSATATPDEYVVLFTTDAVLAQNQAIVVSFPYSVTPPSFTNLEVPIGGVGYNIFFHQPDNPSGANGDLIVIRSAPGSGAVGSFSIEATFVGGSFPLTLPYTIDLFDGSGSSAAFVSNVSSGNAEGPASGVPEPSSVLLSLAGLGVMGYWGRKRRQSPSNE